MVMVLISRVQAKHSQNTVQNPVKVQSSGQLGKCTVNLRNCNHHFHRRLSSDSGHSFPTGGLGFFIFVWFWLFRILFQNSYQVCAIKCGDPRPLQQLLIYRNQYWTNKSDFNACQWLSQSRRHSKVPKNISKYTDLLKRT